MIYQGLKAFEDKYNQSLDLFVYSEEVFRVRVHDYGKLIEDHKFNNYKKAVLKFNEMKEKYEVIFNK